jgi:hypothetical protein
MIGSLLLGRRLGGEARKQQQIIMERRIIADKNSGNNRTRREYCVAALAIHVFGVRVATLQVGWLVFRSSLVSYEYTGYQYD